MQKGRFYLLVLGLAGAVTFGPGVGHSQGTADAAGVNARASAILADIQGRVGNAKSEEQKKCLGEKKVAVNAIKSRIAGAADLSSLMSELNAVGGELDTCTGDKKDGNKSGDNKGSGPGQQVVVTVDEGTPDGESSNPSVIIPPGPTAAGPGVIDNGSNTGGGDFGGTGGDTGGGFPNIPVVPPPPVSPMI